MRSRPKTFFLIFVLGFLNSLTPFSIDLYLPAFPSIARDLHTSIPRVSLSISFYFVAYALGQIIYGPLLDRYGRKKPLYFGIVLYLLASIGCMTSTSIESLIVFRVLSAFGGCATTVGATTMVRDYFPKEDAPKVFSFLMLVISLSPFLAPTLGSLVILHWHWRVIFGVLSAVAIVDMGLVRWALPEAYQPDVSMNLNLKPILLNFKSILQNNQFVTYTLAGGLTLSGLFVFVAGAPSIFFDGFKVEVKYFGIIFALLVGGMIGGGQLNHILIKKFGSRRIFYGALLIAVIVSGGLFIGSALNIFGLVTTCVFLFLLLASAGIALPNSSSLALEPFSKNIGSAASLLGFLQEGLGAVMAAILGLWNGKGTLPTATVMFFTTTIAVGVLLISKRHRGSKNQSRFEN